MYIPTVSQKVCEQNFELIYQYCFFSAIFHYAVGGAIVVVIVW